MTVFEKGRNYQNLAAKLRHQKTNNQKMVLNIHIPGTGCNKDTSIATNVALQVLEGKNAFTPIIYFEGVGSGSDEDYLPPVMANTYTLEDKKLSVKERLRNFIFGTSTSDMDGLGVMNDGLAQASGVVAGAGKKNNTLRAIHALAALKQENLLPEVVHLTGYSRGAVNCIDLANKIYQKFGNAIKIHLTLTDPVPGPMHEHDVEEQTLPPNVVSCNIFYADSEEGVFFSAIDSTRLVVTNPKTTLTFYSAKDSDHFNLGSKSEVKSSIKQLTCAINGVQLSADEAEQQSGIVMDNVEDMKGKSFIRSGAKFYQTTPINSACDNILASAIIDVRQHFEPNTQLASSIAPTSTNSSIKIGERFDPNQQLASIIAPKPTPTSTTAPTSKPRFTMPKIDTEAERKKYIYKQYREQRWQRSHISSGEMLAFLTIIPTLGLSANLYRSSQEMTRSGTLLKFALGLGSANIAPSADMLLDTGRKLCYNLKNGGFFRPGEPKPQLRNEESQTLLEPMVFNKKS